MPLLQIMPLDKESPFTSFLALTGITSALNFIMTANGVPALYTTFAQSSPMPPASPAERDYDSGAGVLHAAAAVSGVTDCRGDGARKVPARAGMLLCIALAAVSYLIPAAGLSVVSGAGETVAV